MWDAVQKGFTRAVTPDHARAGFAKSVLWPLDLSRVTDGRSIRRSHVDDSLYSIDSLIRAKNAVLLDVKRNALPEPLIKSGYIDTTQGIELTREDVFKVLSALEKDRRCIALERERQSDLCRSEGLASKERKRVFAKSVAWSKAHDRYSQHNCELKLPRSFQERRLHVRKMLALKRARARVAPRGIEVAPQERATALAASDVAVREGVAGAMSSS